MGKENKNNVARPHYAEFARLFDPIVEGDVHGDVLIIGSGALFPEEIWVVRKGEIREEVTSVILVEKGLLPKHILRPDDITKMPPFLDARDRRFYSYLSGRGIYDFLEQFPPEMTFDTIIFLRQVNLEATFTAELFDPIQKKFVLTILALLNRLRPGGHLIASGGFSHDPSEVIPTGDYDLAYNAINDEQYSPAAYTGTQYVIKVTK